MQIPRDRLGSTALEWCGYAFIYAFAWLVVGSLKSALLAIPAVGDSVFKILSWLPFLLAPALAAAATVLGLIAIGHAIVTRGSARQALAGLAAIAGCVAGGFGLWWLGAGEQWAVLVAALRGV